MRKVFENVIGLDSGFSYRGQQQTRVETFSDAVFALAITLLVLSSLFQKLLINYGFQ